MHEIDIPGFGAVNLEHLVSDFTGTLSVDGRLLPGVRGQLNEMAKFLKIHILTADTFGKATAELEGIDCEIHILKGKDHDTQKEEYVKKLGAQKVIAFGNGNNDRKMLKTARIGIAVSQGGEPGYCCFVEEEHSCRGTEDSDGEGIGVSNQTEDS